MKSVGFIGGTGDLGTALAIHIAKKYDHVVIGSRNIEKAETTLRDINSDKPSREYLMHISADTNQNVAKNCDIIIATIPHENALETVRSISTDFRGNQILISAAAGLTKIGSQFFPIRSSESISTQISKTLPSTVRVATAFQTIPAAVLYKEREILADVPVACDSEVTFHDVAEVVSSIAGLTPLYVGTLELSGELESLTALLLNIAVRNRLRSPTIKIHSF